MMKTRHTLILALPVLFLVGCAPVEQTSKASETTKAPVTATMSTTSTTAKPTECQPVPEATIKKLGEIERRPAFANATFANWYYTVVPDADRSSVGNPKWPGVVVAAQTTDGSALTATWGLGGFTVDGQPDGLLFPLNETARGIELEQDLIAENSPLGEARRNVAKSKAARQAEKCAIQGVAS